MHLLSKIVSRNIPCFRINTAAPPWRFVGKGRSNKYNVDEAKKTMVDTPEKISRKVKRPDKRYETPFWCTDWSLIVRFCMQIMILCKNADFLFTLYEIKQCPPLCQGANNNISESSTTWMWFYTEAASVPYSWIHAWLDTMGLWFHVYTLLFYAWHLPMYMHYISLLRADFNLMSFPLLGRSKGVYVGAVAFCRPEPRVSRRRGRWSSSRKPSQQFLKRKE